MSDASPKNIVWHEALVSRHEREAAMGQRGCAFWFTGLSGSGKSTIAHAVDKLLLDTGAHAYVLDGDNIRHGLCADLDFSKGAREENIRRVGEVAKLFVDAGVIVLAAFISPFRADRERARALFSPGDFHEIYVEADLAACEARDPKGLYKKARAGEIRDFTGIDSPYEPPMAPEMILPTMQNSPEKCAEIVVAWMRDRKVIAAR